MRQALIAIIHGNLEALQAVLADIASQIVDEILCLGDIVGYGPNPCECLDLVMRRAKLTIMGNHDQAALFDPEGINPVALASDLLDSRSIGYRFVHDRKQAMGLFERIAKLTHQDKFKFVHGFPP